MSGKPIRLLGPALRDLTRDILAASGPQVMRIVALVDAMIRRGPADQLIEPLRERLARLRPPRPLRFDRLLFYPLDLLIVAPTQWRPEHHSLPRPAMLPMAEHVRLAMGGAGTAILAEIDGRTTGDSALVSRLGGALWPEAARILAGVAKTDAWGMAGLLEAKFRPLVGIVATLLAEAGGIDTLRAEAATGLLPVGPASIEAILYRVARVNRSALPMMIALLLDWLPDAAGLLPGAYPGLAPGVIEAALDQATDVLLRQLDLDEGIERRIAAGTLGEAGAAASRTATLLMHLDDANVALPRRRLLRGLRQRLDAGCQSRFATGLQDELLARLGQDGAANHDELEAAARGIRVLEAGGRAAGGGPSYDQLLGEAKHAIVAEDTLPLGERLRLVEILAGPDAALALMNAGA